MQRRGGKRICKAPQNSVDYYDGEELDDYLQQSESPVFHKTFKHKPPGVNSVLVPPPSHNYNIPVTSTPNISLVYQKDEELLRNRWDVAYGCPGILPQTHANVGMRPIDQQVWMKEPINRGRVQQCTESEKTFAVLKNIEANDVRGEERSSPGLSVDGHSLPLVSDSEDDNMTGAFDAAGEPPITDNRPTTSGESLRAGSSSPSLLARRHRNISDQLREYHLAQMRFLGEIKDEVKDIKAYLNIGENRWKPIKTVAEIMETEAKFSDFEAPLRRACRAAGKSIKNQKSMAYQVLRAFADDAVWGEVTMMTMDNKAPKILGILTEKVPRAVLGPAISQIGYEVRKKRVKKSDQGAKRKSKSKNGISESRQGESETFHAPSLKGGFDLNL